MNLTDLLFLDSVDLVESRFSAAQYELSKMQMFKKR